MPKIIHILAHNIEDFITGDYSSFDNHTIRFMEKINKFSNNKYEQELWLLSKKDFSTTVTHKKGFKIRLFPISIKLPLPLEISFSMQLVCTPVRLSSRNTSAPSGEEEIDMKPKLSVS